MFLELEFFYILVSCFFISDCIHCHRNDCKPKLPGFWPCLDDVEAQWCWRDPTQTDAG